MRCPIDGSTLQITDRQGIEIDYCPQCRGVWLDRGELDKIIERTGPAVTGSAGAGSAASAQVDDRRRYDDDDDDDDDYRRSPQQTQTQYKKKKRGSFLEDLFDFG